MDNSLNYELFQKRLSTLSSKWEKYRMQQDFNKWTALRHWIRIPGIRRRLQVLEKDLKEIPSRRYRRLLERIRKSQKVLDQVKSELQDVYAEYHREGKSLYSERTLKKRFSAALVQLANLVSQGPRLYYSNRRYRHPAYRGKTWECAAMHYPLSSRDLLYGMKEC